jgi:hypothetical protein
MTGRDHLVAAPELIAVVDPGHRQLRRYAPSGTLRGEPAGAPPRAHPHRRSRQAAPAAFV